MILKEKQLGLGVLLLTSCVIMLTACSSGKATGMMDTGIKIKEVTLTPTKWPEHMLSADSAQDILKEAEAELEEKVQEEASKGLQNIGEEMVTVVSGSVLIPDESTVIDREICDIINALPAAAVVRVGETNGKTIAECFTISEITPNIYLRMENKSFSEECTTPIANLQYVRILHYGFDGEIRVGELVVNQLIATDIIHIFKELFDAAYPIEQMVLVDEYDADDNLSMEANNTSCFNYREVDGTSTLSSHAYGLAVDINPLYNPYVRMISGKQVILPESGEDYADRGKECEYYIVKGDVCYEAFIARGFSWGGNWEDRKDYQHFEKKFN